MARAFLKHQSILLFTSLLASLCVVCGSETKRESAATKNYAPVTPPPVYLSALESNLDVAGQWLKEKDYKSLGQSARGMEALALLGAARVGDDAWRKSVSDLQQACTGLTNAAQAKNQLRCEAALSQCRLLLAQLKKQMPKEGRPLTVDLGKVTAVKTWMRLMDGAYSDGRFAESTEELHRYVLMLAEEANAVSYLRNDKRWTKMARELSQEALKLAKEIEGKKLAAVKISALERVNKRCLACHKEFRP